MGRCQCAQRPWIHTTKITKNGSKYFSIHHEPKFDKMKESIKNIILLGLVILSFFLIPQIQLLIIYFFISIVISISINPLNNFICNIKISKFQINKSVSAIICLLLFSSLLSLILWIISPLIMREFQIISSVNLNEHKIF